MKTYSFQKKVFLGFSALSLLSMTVCGVVSYYFTSDLVKELTGQNLRGEVESIESAIQVSTADNEERQVKLISYWSAALLPRLVVDAAQAENAEVVNQVTQEKTRTDVPVLLVDGKRLVDHSLADRISGEIGEAVTIFVNLPQGLLRVSTSLKKADGTRAVGTFIPTDSPVYKSLAEKKRYVGRAQVLGQWYVTAYDPIVGGKGELLGAIFLGTPETSHGRLKAFLKAQRVLTSGYFYVLDSKGMMVLHPTLEGENVLATNDAAGLPIFRNIIEKKNGSIQYAWKNANGGSVEQKIAYFQYFPQMDWYVVASVSLQEAEAALAKLKWILLTISVLMTAAMGAATLYMGRAVAGQLLRFSSALEASTATVSGNSAQLASAATALAEASQEQAASIQETAAAVEEIHSIVKRNLESTQSTEASARNMASDAEQGGRDLQDLSESVQEISRANERVQGQVGTTNQQLQRIVEVISQIEQKTSIIHDIVFQTKLLSFNASVEAARSGEAGKGFAVVAEEVGRLAAQSGAAASEIKKSLEESRAEVGTIIQTAEREMNEILAVVSGRVSEGVKNAATSQARIDNILQKISGTHEAVREIAQGSEEQAKGIAEITSAVQQMDLVTQQNATTANRVRSLSEELEGSSRNLGQVTEELMRFVEGEETREPAQVVPLPTKKNEASERRAA